MKITAVSQLTAIFNIQRKSEKCWCLLRISRLTTKKIPGLFQDFPKISVKSQDFPGLFSIPGLSRTGGNHEFNSQVSFMDFDYNFLYNFALELLFFRKLVDLCFHFF